MLKVSPVLFGDGIRLFGDHPYAPRALVPEAVTRFESGVVIAEYSRAYPCSSHRPAVASAGFRPAAGEARRPRRR